MKFEQIAKGDIVFARIEIKQNNWARAHVYGKFFVPCKVVHVTGTMFDAEVPDLEYRTVKKVRFYRESGFERKSSYNRLVVYKEGEEYRDRLDGCIVEDQSSECRKAIDFKNKLTNLSRMVQMNLCPKRITLKQVEEATAMLKSLPLKE
ncbi:MULTISPECIES: hypothetical protein [Vibrio harveyi group]|uniref:hypothetical protein n=1 Tax=Vibrio harveyi group TaxID=717610 RepID=UPI0011103DDF|nr:hypothetical protein [Vibrio parahaemolyticus]MDG2761575.1 hypothetical protein [Vibrio parahaemolyticus]TMX40824.1 hypothetical protein DA098_03060 [Vibrio parahaemolyticus]TMX79871.1 hypothetical protein DA094_05140 [Vibrio parahaemolyticus]